MTLNHKDHETLADAVYEFLVSEGYHGHYPSAEAQAEKFVREALAAVVREIVDRERIAALTAAVGLSKSLVEFAEGLARRSVECPGCSAVSDE